MEHSQKICKKSGERVKATLAPGVVGPVHEHYNGVFLTDAVYIESLRPTYLPMKIPKRDIVRDASVSLELVLHKSGVTNWYSFDSSVLVSTNWQCARHQNRRSWVQTFAELDRMH